MRNKAAVKAMLDKSIHRKIPMNLQLFAESGDGAGAGDNSNGDGSDGFSKNSDGDGKKGNEPKEVSFDDFLKTGKNQAEFDRRVQKAIDTAVSKAQEKWKVLADDKASEAEKLAKMTADEKQQYMDRKRQKELDDREAEITKRELMATAKVTLADKKLPQNLADILVYTDAEACNNSISAVEKAFKEAVESAVQDRLKGSNPERKAPDKDTDTLEKQIENAIKTGLF